MERASRIPDLTLPFGALGGLLGWVFASALGNPIFRGASDINPVIAAAGGAVTAALLGAFLTRRAHAEASGAFLPSALSRWIVLAPPLAVGGAVTGTLVGALSNSAGAGGILGVGCSILAVPLCATVLAAALRAERARLGSLVADADRREAWTALVTVASIATLAELPNAMAWAAIGRPGPWVSLAVAIAAAPLSLAIHLRDRSARRSLAGATRDLEAREHEHPPAGELPLLDLGLGDDLQSRYAHGSSAYRDHQREVAVVRGSPDEARRALDWAVRRGAACLALSTLVAAAHGAALGPFFQLGYATALCDRRDLDGCAGAARALAARDPADPRVGDLYVRACTVHAPAHCASLVTWFEAHPDLERHTAAVSSLREACAIGHAPACALAAGVAERAGDAGRAAALLRRACRQGHAASCERLSR